MKRYRVRHNFRRSQPQHWIGRFVTLYGPHNEGAIVEAETAESAVQAFAEANGLNPFYLEAIPDQTRAWTP